MSFFDELKRRNVFRVAVVYGVSAWLLLQVADLAFDLLQVPDWTLRFIFGLLVALFPFVLVFAWAFEITPDGIKREAEVDHSDIAQAVNRLFLAAFFNCLPRCTPFRNRATLR